MADESASSTDEEEFVKQPGFLSNIVGAVVYGLVGNLVLIGIPTVFHFIFGMLKYAVWVLHKIFFVVIPFVVMYFGIPLFILGLLMGLLFFGGHIFFLIAFFVGIYFYLKGAFNITIKEDKPANPI